MSSAFSPIEAVNMYCRFCKKVVPFDLERSIAGSGRTVDRDSTFEYCCSKCHKTSCFSGQDLLPAEEAEENNTNPHGYSAAETYLIGETINHETFADQGTVVGKDSGSPSKIFVQFEKEGLKKLVEGL
ncbi:MAG: hypothetical protein ACOCW2_02805 [Chitinivibrionales bacterium]